MWSKTLTSAEIDSFMEDKVNPLDIAAANLLAYYDGTTRVDGSDTYLVDQTANGHDLLISGTVTIDTEDDPGVAAPSTDPGVTVTGIKEPNEANTEVTGVSNARVKVWYGTDDTGAEDELRLNQTITNGAMTVDLTGGTVDAAVVVTVDWDAGGGETKFFRYQTTVIDLDAED